MDHREKHEPLISTAYCYGGDFSDENPPMPGLEMMGIPWQQSNESSLRCLFPLNEQTFDHHDLSSDSRDLIEIPTTTTTMSFYHLSSRYLAPAKELLNEFCGFGESENSSKQTHNKWEGVGSPSSSSALNLLNLLELQNRKGTLFSMLEEVDRRYKKYCEQMRAVKAGFEAATGEGTAATYTSKASRVMSKHFRSLRDGITGQLQATKRAMGEKDTIYVGPTKGETPRLRLVDQCLRQQRAAGAAESHPWRPQRGLPERSVSILRAWLFEHFLHPYPTDVDKHILSRQTGLSRSQVSNWFINARVRLWKPMVEEMYMEETKEQDNGLSYTTAFVVNADDVKNPNPSTSELQREADPDSLSSIINGFGSNRRYPVPEKDPHCPRPENFGDVGMDFGSYGDYSGHGFGGGVSLTLGLQQLHDLAR